MVINIHVIFYVFLPNKLYSPLFILNERRGRKGFQFAYENLFIEFSEGCNMKNKIEKSSNIRNTKRGRGKTKTWTEWKLI